MPLNTWGLEEGDRWFVTGLPRWTAAVPGTSPRQPPTVVLLVHEFAWRRDCRSTPAGARTRLTSVRLLRRLRGHGKPCQVLSELPVRKLSYQGR